MTTPISPFPTNSAGSPFMVSPVAAAPVMPATPIANPTPIAAPVVQPQPSQPYQAAPANTALSADMAATESQRQKLLEQLQSIVQEEEQLRTELQALSTKAQAIEQRKEAITQELEILNQKESSWYSQHTASIAPLLNVQSPAAAAVPAPAQPTITTPPPTPVAEVPNQPTTPAETDRLTLIKQTIIAKLQSVPPQGSDPATLQRVLNLAAQFYLAPDLNGLLITYGTEKIQVPSADLIAAGALVDLTVFPPAPAV